MDVPITIVVTLVAAAVPIGIALGKLAAHDERIKSLEKSRERAGARLEALERGIAVDRVRHQTSAKGSSVPRTVADEGSSEHE